jgi:hypothetical protein
VTSKRASTWLRFGLVVVLAGAVACAEPTGPASTPSSAASSPSAGPAKSVPALKLAVLDAIGGRLVYCDPDEFPLPHGSALENAEARFPTIQADRAAFEAILEHEGFSNTRDFTPDQMVVINEDYKQMQAIDLTPAGGGFAFSVQAHQSGPGISRLSGTVSRSGAVSIESREPGRLPECPICLAAGVLIASPDGPIAVEDLRVGTPVWTSGRYGRRIPGVVLRIGSMQTPPGHEIVRLTLVDGRTVDASPGHPTIDGRLVAHLEPGDGYDGSVVASVALIPYSGTTYDLLPSGPTGTYFTNGVPLGSALALTPAMTTPSSASIHSP